jgi:hypothetical protein
MVLPARCGSPGAGSCDARSLGWAVPRGSRCCWRHPGTWPWRSGTATVRRSLLRDRVLGKFGFPWTAEGELVLLLALPVLLLPWSPWSGCAARGQRWPGPGW